MLTPVRCARVRSYLRISALHGSQFHSSEATAEEIRANIIKNSVYKLQAEFFILKRRKQIPSLFSFKFLNLRHKQITLNTNQL
ncbi:MAG: hypothetical protein C0525_13060 [Flavobacterium sp.]|nr:hypothetical protein [Flavobacterium sp.]